MGAIMVSVPASITRPIWETVDLGGDYAISFVRDDGMLVARYPLPATTLDMSGYILFTKYLKEAPAGTYRAETSPMDGVRRVVAYRRVEGTPFIAVAAADYEFLIQPFRQTLLMLGVVAFIIIGGAACTSCGLKNCNRRNSPKRSKPTRCFCAKSITE